MKQIDQITNTETDLKGFLVDDSKTNKDELK